jgi:hypothetical protein
MWSPRFPQEGVDTTNERPILGDLLSFTMPYAPLTDVSGVLALPKDISISKDGTSLVSPVEYVDSSASYVSMFNEVSYWDAKRIDGTVIPSWDTTSIGVAYDFPVIGDEFQFNYKYLADGTVYPQSTGFVYGINYWQLPGAPISNGQGTNLLALPSDVILSIDGTVIPDAVTDIEAINGLITVESRTDFWLASPLGRLPEPGYSVDGTYYARDIFNFNYYKSGASKYVMLFDDPSRVFDDDVVFDGEGMTNIERTPIANDSPLKIGYKFRADLLHHAAVLNSSDTLLLNNYQKPAKRASIINRQDTLNHYNYFFSPEFLTDTDTNIILNDNYLDKNIPAAIELYEGTPTFQQTYAYQPGMIQHKKLTDIRKNHSLLMYCDLLLKETRTGNDEVHLSSICDSYNPKFSIRFREELDPLSECEDWLIFDTGETKQEQMSIPGDLEPVINLRVPGEDLRDNFILREMASTGFTTTSYIFKENDNFQNTYQLPDTTRVTIDGVQVDFPALPVMKDSTAQADSSDVTVMVGGVVTPGLINVFDSTTGYIEFYPQPDSTIIQNITVTQLQINQKFIKLDQPATNPESVILQVNGGSPQTYGDDFEVAEDILYIEDFLTLVAGDVLTVTYTGSPFWDKEIEFIYRIKSTGVVTVVDLDRSRVLDRDIFAYFCYDGYQNDVSLKFNEYVNFLNDFGKGIKFVYLNKDTFQLEEHIFSGPVFETYDASEDEISAIESFPNALIRVTDPLSQKDPLRILPNYDFLNDDAIRIRKKTIKELLPDRTFRTMNIYEALPV